MSWVRIHDGAWSHPKVLALSDGAFRLWVWGLSYAQTHLTNGLIPLDSLPKKYEKFAKELLVTHEYLGRSSLWKSHQIGYEIHDFLDWNESRARVEEKRAAAQTERIANRNRMKEWREAKRAGNVTASHGRNSHAVRAASLSRSKPNQTKPVQEGSPSTQRVKEQLSVGPPTKQADQRPKEFLDWFQAEYKLRRHGADYFVRWEKDMPIVKRLLGATDIDRLKKLAQIMLSDKTEDDFIADSDRGIGVFSAKFNWLSDRLAAWEARQREKTA